MFSGIVEGKGELIAVRSYKRANDETSGMRIKVNWVVYEAQMPK